jgi:hypothetical protein
MILKIMGGNMNFLSRSSEIARHRINESKLMIFHNACLLEINNVQLKTYKTGLSKESNLKTLFIRIKSSQIDLLA